MSQVAVANTTRPLPGEVECQEGGKRCADYSLMLPRGLVYKLVTTTPPLQAPFPRKLPNPAARPQGSKPDCQPDLLNRGPSTYGVDSGCLAVPSQANSPKPGPKP